ncbi:hypothetical protein PJP10_18655 [Mycobacterium kansasii]
MTVRAPRRAAGAPALPEMPSVDRVRSHAPGTAPTGDERLRTGPHWSHGGGKSILGEVAGG